MSFLLDPGDERELVEHLVSVRGMKLLLSDVAANGQPSVAHDALESLPATLPERSGEGVHTLIFWASALGPIRTMEDAPEPIAAGDRVARVITRQNAGHEHPGVIDLTRTPVLRWLRCSWFGPGRIIPGLLQAMPVPTKELPPQSESSETRWSAGSRPGPAASIHSNTARSCRVRHLGPLWVWALPSAWQAVAGGLEVWPWTA